MPRLDFIVAPGFQVTGVGALPVRVCQPLSWRSVLRRAPAVEDRQRGAQVARRQRPCRCVRRQPLRHGYRGGATGLAVTTPALIAFVQQALLRSTVLQWGMDQRCGAETA